MNVAIVTQRYLPAVGGIEMTVAQVAPRLAAMGHAVEVLTQEPAGALARDAREIRADAEVVDGVVVRRFPAVVLGTGDLFAPGLWRYLRHHRSRYDVVHAHNYHALPALGAALAAQRGFVFSPHYHGSGHSPARRLLHVPYRAAGAAIFARARRVVCNSQAEATLVCRSFPRSAGRITVIPPGVDRAAILAARPYPVGEIVLLSAGRLEAHKNVGLVIHALAHLDDRFMLYVIGDGPMRRPLEAMRDQLGLQKRVIFLGRIPTPDLHRWLKTATVFAGMSRREAFGITIVEALAAGAAVVASGIPAHREVAQATGGAMSLLPPTSTPSALAAALRAAARRGHPRCAPAGIASWDDVAARTLAVYRDLAAPWGGINSAEGGG